MSVLENAAEQTLSSGAWSVDSTHSTVEFRVKHMLIQTVRGRFRDFDGTIATGDEPAVSGSIRVASLETLQWERDAHLRSEDFFDADRYPTITFENGDIRFDGDDRHFVLVGELTIKGITRTISLDGQFHGVVVDTDGTERIALTLRGRLDRSAYGLVWNRTLETGSVVVGNTVELVLDIAAVRTG